MRKDMQKVIVEGARLGPRLKTHRASKGDPEALPKQQGMSRSRYAQPDYKTFNDKLNPLMRYLRRQCGRLWDKVYSEVCQAADRRSTVGAHLRDHLDELVALHLKVGPGGRLHDPAYRWPGLRGRYWHQPFYVDPRTGILGDSRVQWRKYRRRQR